MIKIYGWLTTFKVEGYLIQEVKWGVEILVIESDYKELIGTKICLLHSGIVRREEVEEVAITKEVE